MADGTGLVDAAGIAGRLAAVALAMSGLDVTLATSDEETVAFDRLRELNVEVRRGIRVVGSVPVDQHVEVELSDGRVENYDVVVVAHPEHAATPWEVLASDAVRRRRTVPDDVLRMLGALRAPS
nr:hypothetical protein [Microbacterium bovistercoris]